MNEYEFEDAHLDIMGYLDEQVMQIIAEVDAAGWTLDQFKQFLRGSVRYPNGPEYRMKKIAFEAACLDMHQRILGAK